MKQLFAFLLIFTTILYSGDMSGGAWTKKNIVEDTWGFIKDQRAEMKERVKAVYEETSDLVTLQFQLDENLKNKNSYLKIFSRFVSHKKKRTKLFDSYYPI
jgi:hypothetical protein